MNPNGTPESLRLEINGVASLASKGSAITLAGNLDDSNSITHPRKIFPVTTTVRGIKPVFSYTMPPHSIVVLKLKVRP